MLSGPVIVWSSHKFTNAQKFLTDQSNEVLSTTLDLIGQSNLTLDLIGLSNLTLELIGKLYLTTSAQEMDF